ncbi:UNVERIFIED_ORG: hypothetical protein M2402_005246 [Rahnella aquatilis]
MVMFLPPAIELFLRILERQERVDIQAFLRLPLNNSINGNLRNAGEKSIVTLFSHAHHF